MSTSRSNDALFQELTEKNRIIGETECDALTGLYTREFFFVYAHRSDKESRGKARDAIVIDFNRFRLVNELHGVSYGDRVLCAMAEGIREVVDETGGLACRYDGDTFYLYISHVDDYGRIIDTIKEKLSFVMNEPEMRLRMGIYSDEYRTARLEERFERARLACNTLKGRFTSAYAEYDQEMHEKDLYSERLMDGFYSAISSRQFTVMYQPKYDIQGEAPVLYGAEALISWDHPELGRITPDVFIPLFEKKGLIQRLDRYVWEECAGQIKKWKDMTGVSIPVSVNISRVDIYDPEIVEFIEALLKRNGIGHEDMVLEVTESAYMDNPARMIQVVERLRNAGFKVEMDDFGSGFSSLNMLTTLPVDAIKLDTALIKDIEEGKWQMRMVDLVLEIADFLGVPVIAEGVENSAQYDLLKKAGCDMIQGYYFSKPVTAEELSAILQNG